MEGMRKKITVGFLSLAILLFFSGMISLFELNRLSHTTQVLLDTSKKNMEIAKRMLDAVQDQNTALLQMVVLGDNSYDSLYMTGVRDFDNALLEATVTIRDLSQLDSVYSARQRYNSIIETHLDSDRANNIHWFVNIYKTSYYDLTSSIKNYMIASQNILGLKAAQLESTAYRAITPGILALSVAIIILLMFLFFIDLYFVKPVIGIQRSLKGYISSKVPFSVKMEGKDEVHELKEEVEELITMYKNKKNN